MELKSLEETQNFSQKISNIASDGDIIFLYGEIGSGKTTFTRFFINHLENKNNIKNSNIPSPTFNIVYDYDVKNIKISHYDLYRLKSYEEVYQLGIFEELKNQIKIIEWPELIEPKPIDRIDIIFKYSKSENSRTAIIKGFGKWKDYQFNEI